VKVIVVLKGRASVIRIPTAATNSERTNLGLAANGLARKPQLLGLTETP